MRRIIAQARKELTQIVRDWRTLALALVLPVILLALLSAALSLTVTEPIDDTARVILSGSVPSKARLSDDQGPADPSLQIPFITLSMKPSAAQQADLARAPY